MMENVTQLLERIESGDSQALDDLFPIVYEELRRLAASHLAKDFGNNTLQATALVNEAYVRLVGANQTMSFTCRRRFFSAASKAMRSIIIDAARRRLSLKRGGDQRRESIDLDEIVVHRVEELLAVDLALDALADHDSSCAELVKLHYFSGFSIQEISEIMGISRSTANRLWKYSRAWLKVEIESQEN
ncbi:ECF-type sigma factor [Pirellulaceae bacterium SH501]